MAAKGRMTTGEMLLLGGAVVGIGFLVWQSRKQPKPAAVPYQPGWGLPPTIFPEITIPPEEALPEDPVERAKKLGELAYKKSKEMPEEKRRTAWEEFWAQKAQEFMKARAEGKWPSRYYTPEELAFRHGYYEGWLTDVGMLERYKQAIESIRKKEAAYIAAPYRPGVGIPSKASPILEAIAQRIPPRHLTSAEYARRAQEFEEIRKGVSLPPEPTSITIQMEPRAERPPREWIGPIPPRYISPEEYARRRGELTAAIGPGLTAEEAQRAAAAMGVPVEVVPIPI